MPLPEGYLPREGDELLIRCRVSYDVKLTGESVHVSVVGADHHRPIVPMKSVHGLYIAATGKKASASSTKMIRPAPSFPQQTNLSGSIAMLSAKTNRPICSPIGPTNSGRSQPFPRQRRRRSSRRRQHLRQRPPLCRMTTICRSDPSTTNPQGIKLWKSKRPA